MVLQILPVLQQRGLTPYEHAGTVGLMITELRADWWEGVSDLGAPVPNPSWEDCERAIEVLDQRQRTSVFLISDDAGELSLAGGNGRCFLELATPDERFLSPLVSDDEGLEPLVAGGQRGDFPRRFVADSATALRVAEHFYVHEETCPDFDWVPNNEFAAG